MQSRYQRGRKIWIGLYVCVPKLLKSFSIILLTSGSCRILYLGEYLDDGWSCISFINFQHYFITWIILVCKAVMKIYKPRHTVLPVLCLLWWKKPIIPCSHIKKPVCLRQTEFQGARLPLALQNAIYSEKNPLSLFFLAVCVLTWDEKPETLWKGGYNLPWAGRNRQIIWLYILFQKGIQ